MTDDWGFYERRENSERLRILVNVGYKDRAPLAEYGELLSVTINLYAIMRNSRSKQEVVTQLEKTEASLENWLSSHSKALYVGRINTVNRLEFFYYVNRNHHDDVKFREWIKRQWDFRVADYVKPDPEWSFYRYLLPDTLEQLYVHNAQMVYALIHKGDDIKQPREVYHWLKLKQAEDRLAVESALQALGYRIERDKEGEPDSAYPFPLVISRYDNVMLDTVNERVRELYRLLVGVDGRYEGWGSAMRLKGASKMKYGLRKWRAVLEAIIKRIWPFHHKR
ncbi:DUF695 domain-containing protein [Paenibacillus sp. GCM10027626]|uniref:DUF695 domain-containing protein n=1 Tax=Paenibacillus sp. GCM10027626 TaxID=3273411 RepID=UPI0036411FDF